VAEHELFKRDGYDVYYELPINVAQAALGSELQIPTLDGDVELTVPAGTQHGRDFRLRGKGVPHLRSSARGDMHVIAKVVTPSRLNNRQRELFEELAVELDGQAESDDKGFFNRVKEAFGG
jgi:molecular chaperone DnaJ